MSLACRGRFHACKSAHPREEFQFRFFVPILIRIGDCLYGESVGELHGTDVYVSNTGRLNTARWNELKTNINSNTQRHQIAMISCVFYNYIPTMPQLHHSHRHTPAHTRTYANARTNTHKDSITLHSTIQHSTSHLNTGTTQHISCRKTVRFFRDKTFSRNCSVPGKPFNATKQPLGRPRLGL